VWPDTAKELQGAGPATCGISGLSSLVSSTVSSRSFLVIFSQLLQRPSFSSLGFFRFY
jgi:hypothetical protein